MMKEGLMTRTWKIIYTIGICAALIGVGVSMALLIQAPQNDAGRPVTIIDTSTPPNIQQTSESVCEWQTGNPKEEGYLFDLCLGDIPSDLNKFGLINAGLAYCEGVYAGGTYEEGIEAAVQSGVLNYDQAVVLTTAAQDAFCPEVQY